MSSSVDTGVVAGDASRLVALTLLPREVGGQMQSQSQRAAPKDGGTRPAPAAAGVRFDSGPLRPEGPHHTGETVWAVGPSSKTPCTDGLATSSSHRE